MIAISNKESNESVGSITDSQLQILIDHLEKTDPDDQDYYIDRRTIDLISSAAADYAAVVTMLERALGDRESVDIVWSR